MTVRSGSTADSVKKYAFRYSRGWRTAYGDAEPADSVTELSLFPALKLPCHSVSAGQADEPVVYQERQGLPRHFSSSDNCVSRIPFLRSYLEAYQRPFCLHSAHPSAVSRPLATKARDFPNLFQCFCELRSRNNVLPGSNDSNYCFFHLNSRMAEYRANERREKHSCPVSSSAG